MKKKILNMTIIILTLFLILLVVVILKIKLSERKTESAYSMARSTVQNVKISINESSTPKISYSQRESSPTSVLDELMPSITSSNWWIYIPNTCVDYPLAQGEDNLYYLTHDAFGNEADAGAIFINCENSYNLTDFKTIIYGHYKSNGTMFHDIRNYSDCQYGKEHNKLYIYNEEGTIYIYSLKSYAVVDCYDLGIYDVTAQENITEFAEYIQSVSTINYDNYSDENPVIILSTCKKHGTNDRSIVVFQLEK